MKKKNNSSKCFAVCVIVINLLTILGLFIFIVSPVAEFWLNILCILAITAIALISDLLLFKRMLAKKVRLSALSILAIGALTSAVAKIGTAELTGHIMFHNLHSSALTVIIVLLLAILVGAIIDYYLMKIFKVTKGKKTLFTITLALWLPSTLAAIMLFLEPLWMDGVYFDSSISTGAIATISAFIILPLFEVFLATRVALER